jgi:hypothetical protein
MRRGDKIKLDVDKMGGVIEWLDLHDVYPWRESIDKLSLPVYSWYLSPHDFHKIELIFSEGVGDDLLVQFKLAWL